MKIINGKVIFYDCDRAFVGKFGEDAAAEMVLNFKFLNSLPFIFDVNQLADFFHTNKETLFYYVRHSDREYSCLTVKKKNGGTRSLYAPTPKLKFYQNIILKNILAKLPISKYATAYAKGSALARNAEPHVGKKYLLKLDITDFFGSIDFEKVYVSVFNTRYFPKQIGLMLTSLCLRRDTLPQGASTSPAVSNLVMRNFDNNIGKWCASRGISYTRYCDDMTFSSDSPLFAVYQKVKSMLDEMGFELNEKKTEFIKNTGRQYVTGLTVNEKISVSGEYKRKLRQEIYYALKFGFAESIMYSGITEFINGKEPDSDRYLTHLIGKLRFVLQIEPDNEWFRKSLQKLEEKNTIKNNSLFLDAPEI